MIEVALTEVKSVESKKASRRLWVDLPWSSMIFHRSFVEFGIYKGPDGCSIWSWYPWALPGRRPNRTVCRPWGGRNSCFSKSWTEPEWTNDVCIYNMNIYISINQSMNQSINLSIYQSINLSIYLSKYIYICVCVEHLNRCKTSTCWRFRFSWIFSVSGISLCWRSCLHDCAVIYLHSRGAVHDWQTLPNEVSSAYLHGF